MHRSMIILYVADQERSKQFYETVFDKAPDLHVPGMTEFKLNDGSSLGLMPEQGIKNLLGEALPDPAKGTGIPRAELYLLVQAAAVYHGRSLASGARELSAMAERGWGDSVAYSLDPDGHVLAFAEQV